MGVVGQPAACWGVRKLQVHPTHIKGQSGLMLRVARPSGVGVRFLHAVHRHIVVVQLLLGLKGTVSAHQVHGIPGPPSRPLKLEQGLIGRSVLPVSIIPGQGILFIDQQHTIHVGRLHRLIVLVALSTGGQRSLRLLHRSNPLAPYLGGMGGFRGGLHLGFLLFCDGMFLGLLGHSCRAPAGQEKGSQQGTEQNSFAY